MTVWPGFWSSLQYRETLGVARNSSGCIVADIRMTCQAQRDQRAWAVLQSYIGRKICLGAREEIHQQLCQEEEEFHVCTTFMDLTRLVQWCSVYQSRSTCTQEKHPRLSVHECTWSVIVASYCLSCSNGHDGGLINHNVAEARKLLRLCQKPRENVTCSNWTCFRERSCGPGVATCGKKNENKLCHFILLQFHVVLGFSL